MSHYSYLFLWPKTFSASSDPCHQGWAPVLFVGPHLHKDSAPHSARYRSSFHHFCPKAVFSARAFSAQFLLTAFSLFSLCPRLSASNSSSIYRKLSWIILEQDYFCFKFFLSVLWQYEFTVSFILSWREFS